MAFSITRVFTGSVAILAIGLGILGPIAIMLIPKSDDRGCSNVEYQIQEAAKCAAFPHLWKRWEEIAKAYGRGEFSCPSDVDRGVSLGLSKTELRNIGLWMHQNDSNLRAYWHKKHGVEFCKEAELRGWLR